MDTTLYLDTTVQFHSYPFPAYVRGESVLRVISMDTTLSFMSFVHLYSCLRCDFAQEITRNGISRTPHMPKRFACSPSSNNHISMGSFVIFVLCNFVVYQKHHSSHLPLPSFSVNHIACRAVVSDSKQFVHSVSFILCNFVVVCEKKTFSSLLLSLFL